MGKAELVGRLKAIKGDLETFGDTELAAELLGVLVEDIGDVSPHEELLTGLCEAIGGSYVRD